MVWSYRPICIFFLLQAMGALSFVDRLAYGEWSYKSGDKLTQALNLVMIFAGIRLLFMGYHRLPDIRPGATLALALAFFLLMSTLWSIDPSTTMRRGILYILFVIGTIGIASNMEGDEFFELIRIACFLAAVTSIILLVLLPSDAIMQDDNPALRGAFSHKNVLGEVMAAGVLACLHGLRSRGVHTARYVLMLGLFVILTLASKSSTALVTVVAFCFGSFAIWLCRHGGTVRILGLLFSFVFVASGVAFALVPDLILDFLGKDPTLTGRTELWDLVIYYIYERPLLGWGFDAFWSPVNGISGAISDILGWSVPHAHNGLLEMLLEVGIAGTALFVFVFIRNVVLALRCLQTRAVEVAITSLLCYGGILLVGITEEALVDTSQASVNMFFVTGFLCERALRAARNDQVAIMATELAGDATAHI